MLEGKNVNLRVEEKEDVKLVAEWLNNPDYWGEYLPLIQQSRTELEKEYDANHPETKWFMIEKERWKQNWIYRILSYNRESCGNRLFLDSE